MGATTITIDLETVRDAAFFVADDGTLRPANAAARHIEANDAVFLMVSKVVASTLDRNVASVAEMDPSTGACWSVTIVASVNGEKVAMVRELPLPTDGQPLRGIVHELRNIGFGLLMTAEDIAEECPATESVRLLRGFVARITEMADVVFQLLEPSTASLERVSIDTVVEALRERFPTTTVTRIGVRGLVALGDAQLLLRALAVLLAFLAEKSAAVTVATARDDDGVHIEVAAPSVGTLRPSLGAELAKRLMTAQGGRLHIHRDGRLAFVTTLREAQEGAP